MRRRCAPDRADTQNPALSFCDRTKCRPPYDIRPSWLWPFGGEKRQRRFVKHVEKHAPFGRMHREADKLELTVLEIDIDAIDIKILNELQKEGRLTNVQLADRVGLSPSPCLSRVRALEESGLILRYVALLDPHKLGAVVSVFVQVTLERQIENMLQVFETAVGGFPEVMECYLMTGDSDYLLRVVVNDVEAFQRFIVEKLVKVKGVATIRSSFALKQVKYQTAYPVINLVGSGTRRRHGLRGL